MWSATIDRAGLERTHQGQRTARFLTLADTPTGTRVTGLLDTTAGHRLRLALEAVAGKPAPDDVRSPEQRRADALDAMAGTTLASPPSPDGPTGRRPHVSFVMTPQTWSALRATRFGDDAQLLSASGPTSGPALETASAPATLEDGTPVPDTELARALCDCELTRLVLGADSEPMDLGRAVRTYTPGQRRAITARDAGCLWPGCGSPARWCEVHHLVWWDRDDGETAVLDGALACSFHHHEIHRLDLTVTRFGLPPSDGPDTRRTAYAITTAEGRVIADGRPGTEGGSPRGTPVRTWIPGTGAVDEPPEQLRSAPPPHSRHPGRSGVSVGPGSLLAWTSG
jgi:hypothetical protein